jgi:hypothetical protein
MKTSVLINYRIVSLILLSFLFSIKASPQSRIIDFSGFQWIVSDNIPTPSGTNVFKSDATMQFVDTTGRLHLKLKKVYGVWYGSQLQMKESSGYGEYTFYVESDLGNQDNKAVLGLMIKDDKNNNNIIDPSMGEGEMDILFSSWNGISKQRGWYVVPPMPFECKWIYNCNKVCPCVKSFNIPVSAFKKTTHKIVWNKLPDKGLYVYFQSYLGNYKDLPESRYLIGENYYNGSNIPINQNEKITLNFWLFGDNVPASLNGATELEVIIKSVKFIPGKQKPSRTNNLNQSPKKQKKEDSINSIGASL